MEAAAEKPTATVLLDGDQSKQSVKSVRKGLDEEPPADCEHVIAGSVSWSAWFIVVTELCERLTFYGASLMFQRYMLENLHLGKDQATAINRGFSFFAYFTTILGAIIADVKFGKFRTILIFSVFYTIGLIILSASASPASFASGFALPGFIIATYVFIAFGTGGIKSNVSSFVADQVKPGFEKTDTPGVYIDSRLTLERVFRYFYWAINVGAVIGMAVCPVVSKEVSFSLAYGIPAIMFGVGIIVFVLGRSHYLVKDPNPHILLKAYGCIKYALANRGGPKVEHWLYRAKVPGQIWDDQFVNELAESLSGCKVFLFYPVYWALYNNMSDCFISQGVNMTRPDWLGPEQLNLINAIVIIVAIPIFDVFVFPFLRRAFGWRLGPITRITVGFAIVTIGFIYVTILQKVLYSTGPYYNFTNVPADVELPINNLSVWWQTPAYIGIGISEIFASATGLEFAYKRATPELKSIVMSLFLLTNCGGSLIGLALAKWSIDPYFVTVFGVETAAMGVITVAFYWTFRKLDKELL